MLRITKGETVALVSVLRRNRQPVDISAWDIKAAIRQTPGHAGFIDGTVVLLENQTGAFRIEFESTEVLPVGELILSVRFVQPGGLIRTINQRMMVTADDNW